MGSGLRREGAIVENGVSFALRDLGFQLGIAWRHADGRSAVSIQLPRQVETVEEALFCIDGKTLCISDSAWLDSSGETSR
jgi:hypothetical protein